MDYRQEMRLFVRNLSAWSKAASPGFIVIPQNGIELLTDNGDIDGVPVMPYIDAIDGVGQEDLFYGYDEDDVATPDAEREFMVPFLDIAEENGVEVMVTDYCSDHGKVDDSYERNSGRGFISFAADHRALDHIPDYPAEPYNASDHNITALAEARNFLYLINPGGFPGNDDFLEALNGTDYDVLLLDAFFEVGDPLTSGDVASLRNKAGGGSRLVIAYMSIGEAEDYRYYWQEGWESNPPSWLAGENPHWEGNYKVRYWEKEWQDVIFGSEGSYLNLILDAGFDGVYLDIIDAFEYFEGLE